MTKTQKIIGSSVVSILLLTITLFSMCGIRMQRINNEDDAAIADASEQQQQDEMLDKLEFLDDEDAQDTTSDELSDDAIFTEMDAQPSTDVSSSQPDNFLTPELMQKMQAEINDLEKLQQIKDEEAAKLRRRKEQLKMSEVANKGAQQTQSFARNPLFVDKSLQASTGVETEASEFQLYYQDALDDYYTRRYKSAIRKFRNLLLRADAGNLADNCQYWIGESYFALGDYYQAVAEFEKVYAWANSNKTSDAQLMVAVSLFKAGETQLARVEFNNLLSFYQNGAAAQKARQYLSMLERV